MTSQATQHVTCCYNTCYNTTWKASSEMTSSFKRHTTSHVASSQSGTRHNCDVALDVPHHVNQTSRPRLRKAAGYVRICDVSPV